MVTWDWRRGVSLLMIFLVLILPLNTSIVFAEINGVSVFGDDAYEGAISSSNDVIQVGVNLDEQIDAQNLIIDFDAFGIHPFTSCNGFDCFFSLGRGDRLEQEVEYTIKQIEQSSIVDTHNGLFVIDGFAPEIEDFSMDKDGYDLTFEYDVEDTACVGCQDCAGVKELSMYQDETLVATIEADGSCSFTDELETTIYELNLAPGESELCLTAIDTVGHESNEDCVFILVDRDGPYFVSDSLKIFRIDTDQEIFYTQGQPIPVQVRIDIQDEGLDLTSVKADLSGLNSVAGDGYANLQGSCAEATGEDVAENTYTCLWSNYLIDSVSGVVALIFTAQDSSGNEGSYTATYELIEDDTPPEVVDITRVVEEVPFEFYTEELFLKEGLNKLVFQLNPTGSAFEHERVYFSLGSVGVTHKQVDECSLLGGSWNCYSNVTIGGNVGGSAQLQVHTDTRDDAGNGLTEPYFKQIILDTQEPSFVDVEMSHICPTSSEILILTIEVEENTDSLGVYAEPELITNLQQRVSQLCFPTEEGKFSCELTLSNFVSYAQSETVDVHFVDGAGNELIKPIRVDVCESVDIGEVDFLQVYSSDVDTVDRRTLSLLEYPVFVPLTIQARTSGVDILEQTVSCEGAASAYFVGDGIQSDMVVKLAQGGGEGGSEGDELTLTCTLQFSIKRGMRVFTTPELEEVEIVVPLYGTPLGTVAEGIQEKLDGLTAEIDEAEETINGHVKWNTIFGWICIFAESLGKLNAVMGAVKAVTFALGVVGKELEDKPAPAPAIGKPLVALWTALCNLGNKFDLAISRYVWPPGFGIGGGSFPLIKYACILYSGKLCDGFDGWTTLWGFADRGDRYGYDSETGVVNDIYTLPMVWDPYRSIHTARTCLFLTGVIYNLRKERQVNCMRRTCIEENARVGLPIDMCDVLHKERTCLYVESAQWKALNMAEAGQAVSSFLFNGFIARLEWFAGAVIYQALRCPQALDAIEQGEDSDVCQDPSKANIVDGLWYVGCQIGGAALVIQETGGIKGFLPWTTKNMEAKLPGTDYCI